MKGKKFGKQTIKEFTHFITISQKLYEENKITYLFFSDENKLDITQINYHLK